MFGMPKWVLRLVFVLCLPGCASTAYVWQATKGHALILMAAKPVEEVLAKPGLPARLRTQLEHSQDIRDFSVSVLSLPDNASYRRFADLERRYVVWNVVATAQDSLQLKETCFPVTGCISYLGFYAEEDARSYADRMREKNMDVAVVGVPAYSTLGFTADPLLNTFIYLPAGELARLIFHELAHQVLYVKDDTQFNESFASAVEELGVERWLAAKNSSELTQGYYAFDAKRKAFRLMLAQARLSLKSIYDNPVLTRAEKLAMKQSRIEALHREYATLKESWGGWGGFDPYMSIDVNNAKLAIAGLYDDYMPAFRLLFERCGANFPAFYEAARNVGDQGSVARGLFGKIDPSFQVGCPSSNMIKLSGS